MTRHIVERGLAGACFRADDDYLVYLDRMQEAAERHRCHIHAYTLMIDQAHLLASAATQDRLARMMRCVRTRYLEYVNYVHQGTGAFSERHRESNAIEGERTPLDYYRLIEALPVAARIAASPAAYHWSSYNHHAYGSADGVIRDHPAYLALGSTENERRSAYRESFPRSPGEAPPPVTGMMRVSGARPHPMALVH